MSRISIIIPVYNDQLGLDECLFDLENQSLDHCQFEVVVVDNQSSPPIEIPKSLSFQIHYTVCDKTGSYAARNKGVNSASGEIIAFLDADCKPDQKWLEQGSMALLENSVPCAIGGEVLLSTSDKPSATELYQCLTGFGQINNIEISKFSTTANLFVRKDNFLEIGPFNESLLSGGDREWCWRAVESGIDLKYCPFAIVRTSPRTSLKSAILQARRVAGGRRQLRALGLNHGSNKTGDITHRRSAMQSLKWILVHPEISVPLRFKVLWVATILRTVQFIETTRLQLGFAPERG